MSLRYTPWIMTDRPFESDVDRAFVSALEHFLQREGLSIQSFCRRTRKFSDTGDRMMILPTQVTKWRRDMMPSAKAAMITAATFGVTRSFFYFVGEQIEKGREPPRIEDQLSKRRLTMIRGVLEDLEETDDIDEKLLLGLEETLALR